MADAKTDCKPGRQTMSVRMATEADGKALNDLYNEVFGEERPLAHWRWKFPEGPARDWHVVNILAEVNGRIIGSYPCQIRPVSFQGQPARFALVMDNIVAEAFRRGYPAQKEMFGYAVKMSAENGMAIGYGFPNERAYKVGKRLLGYHDVAVLPELFFRLSWRPAIAKRLPWLPEAAVALLAGIGRRCGGHLDQACAGEPVTVEAVDRFSTEIDPLWERLKTVRTICAERSSSFLNWRFGRDDIIPYRRLIARNRSGAVAGYLVCRCMPVNGDRIGYLTDFLFESDTILAHLLKKALALLNRERADYVSVMVSPGTAEEQALKRFGFEAKEGFGGRPFVVLALDGSLPFETVLDPTRWYLTYGDSDLV